MPTKGSPVYSLRYPQNRAEKLEAVAAARRMTPGEWIRWLVDIALGFASTEEYQEATRERAASEAIFRRR